MNHNGSTPNPFEKLLDDLKKETGGGGGRFYHPPKGKSQFRLILEPGANLAENPAAFFRPVTTPWGKTKYLILAVVLSGPDLDQEQPPEIRGLVVPTTVLQEIVGYLASGFELFDPKTGHGIAITRDGTGKKDTRYSVSPSPKPVDITKLGTTLEMPDGGLEELQNAYNKREAAGTETPGDDQNDNGKTGLPW